LDGKVEEIVPRRDTFIIKAMGLEGNMEGRLRPEDWAWIWDGLGRVRINLNFALILLYEEGR